MKVYMYIAVMALVTYLIRVIPLTVFHERIENRYLRSFLYYVPYTCLTAVVLAFYKKSLVTVAAAACLAVFVTELFL